MTTGSHPIRFRQAYLMSMPLVRIILYVRDVATVEAFYREHFDADTVERIENEWVVFKMGPIELALHRAGASYRKASPPTAPTGSTTKLVFAITSDLAAHRDSLSASGVSVGPIKRYDGFPYAMYDGRDPEGNVFQVMRYD